VEKGTPGIVKHIFNHAAAVTLSLQLKKDGHMLWNQAQNYINKGSANAVESGSE